MTALDHVYTEGTGPQDRLTPAVIADGFVFTSGTVGLVPGQTTFPESFRDEVEQAIDNLENTLRAAGSDLAHVVKALCFVSERSLFEEFNAVYAERFPAPRPARSTVFNSIEGFRVEIEVVAVLAEERA